MHDHIKTIILQSPELTWIEYIPNWTTAVATLLIAIVPIFIGIKGWLKSKTKTEEAKRNDIANRYKEDIERKNADLAAEIIENFHLVRESIDSIRNPFGYTSETIEAKEYIEKQKPTNDKHGFFKIPNTQGVIFRLRFDKQGHNFAQLYKLRLKTHIFLGQDIEFLFDRIQQIIKNISANIFTLQNFRDNDEQAYKWMEKIWMITSKEEDKISQELDKIITELEEKLIPLVRGNP